ncbi:hypothetical protein CR513_03474, partial [Mucuna pruriens]
MEKETRLRLGSCLKAVDQEMCFRRIERDQVRAENEKLKEALLGTRIEEEGLRSQHYLLQEKVDLLEEKMARDRQYQEDLEVQRGQGLVELVEERQRVADSTQQAQATIEELKTKTEMQTTYIIENKLEYKVRNSEFPKNPSSTTIALEGRRWCTTDG